MPIKVLTALTKNGIFNVSLLIQNEEALKYDYIWAPKSCGAIGATGLYMSIFV